MTIDTKALRNRLDGLRLTEWDMSLSFEEVSALLDAADRLAALEAENQRMREVMRSTSVSLHIMARRGTAGDPGVLVCALNLHEALATGGGK